MFFFKYKNIKILDETDLISGYRQTGKSNYLEVLYDRYFHLIYGVCLKYLKDKEESKEAVIIIFEKLEKDILKNELLNIKAWLYTVSRNHCLTVIKAKKRDILSRNNIHLDLLGENLKEESADENKYEQAIQNMSLFIQQLKEGQRQCIHLFFIENKSYKEITDITGYDLKQVKSFLQNGKRALGIRINEQIKNEKR